MSKVKVEYVPAHSKFTAKTVTRKGVTHIELRRNFNGGGYSTQMLVFVALNDGYNKDQYEAVLYDSSAPLWLSSTQGVNVRLSLNGPAKMTISDFQEIYDEVNAAYDALRWWELNGHINQ